MRQAFEKSPPTHFYASGFGRVREELIREAPVQTAASRGGAAERASGGPRYFFGIGEGLIIAGLLGVALGVTRRRTGGPAIALLGSLLIGIGVGCLAGALTGALTFIAVAAISLIIGVVIALARRGY